VDGNVEGALHMGQDLAWRVSFQRKLVVEKLPHWHLQHLVDVSPGKKRELGGTNFLESM
jgi:hypothetical protein